MSTNADLVREARQMAADKIWAGPDTLRVLANALEAAELRNPPPEYYAENLAELHEEIAALKRERAALRAMAEAAEAAGVAYCGNDNCNNPLCVAYLAWKASR